MPIRSLFYRKAYERKAKNDILGLEDEDSRWQDEVEEVKAILERSFHNIFTSRCSLKEETLKVLEIVQHRISP